MKAFTYHQYGPPKDVLSLSDIPKPVPGVGEVLVKVRAAAVNDYDWSMTIGKPLAYRLLFGVKKPKHLIPGMELSGTVEAVGPDVQTLKVGDAVYGDISEFGFGAFAEYVAVNEKGLVIKPERISFEEAASISHAAMLAYQGLIDMGKIERHQKILINGAGGGVGTFGLQLAKLYEGEVTGVDTGDKLQMMSSLGFDHIIDYKKEDFTKNGQQYDLILDCKTTRSPFSYLSSLTRQGSYVTVGGTVGRLLQLLLARPWIHRFSKKRMSILALKANKDLSYINQLLDENKLQFMIDGPYPLEKLPELIQYFGEGKHQGKVIVTI